MDAPVEPPVDLAIPQVAAELVARRPPTPLDDIEVVAFNLRALSVGVRPWAKGRLPFLLTDLEAMLNGVAVALRDETAQHEAAAAALQEITEIHHPLTRAGQQWCHGCSVPRDPEVGTWAHLTDWPCRTYTLAAGWDGAA